MPDSPHLYLIDGSSYIYRAFYAIRQYLSNSKGLPTNAVFGFSNMLLKVLKEEKPDYLAIAFDPRGKTFRHEEYKEYKAQRPDMPEDLVPQIPYIHKLVDAFNIPIIMKEGYEADDFIGTVAKRAREKGFTVTIISGDKDLLQLVEKGIVVKDTMKDKTYDSDAVKERFGVGPSSLVEVMALMGDKIDNIPGVPGVGEKTAVELIKEFESIDNLYKNLPKVKREKLRQNLDIHREEAELSRRLCTIDIDMPVEVDLEELKLKEVNEKELVNLFKELGFSKLLREFTAKKEVSKKEYQSISDKDTFDELITKLKNAKEFAIDLETTHKEPMRADIVGLSFSFKENEAFYIPVAHEYAGAPEQLGREKVLSSLKPLLEDAAIKKSGQNIKYEILVLGNAGIDLKGVSFDTMLASYLINPSRRQHNLEEIALEYLDYKMTTYKEVVGTGKKEIGFQEVDIETATNYSGEDADITFTLSAILSPMLKEKGLDKLFSEVELPLVNVLAEIERNGVRIDVDCLQEMSKSIAVKLDELNSTIYSLAGREFNINSPIQLREILFDELKLTPLKKTKTGYSTDVNVLEQLALQHELPAQMLNFRQLSKLKSTYVDALPLLINPKTGRIHTSFNQTVAATGRLSSSGPNLQNIPIRTELGREMRKAFIADKGNLLLSADYSQIELRLLAHLSGDEALILAFQKGEDIHTSTARDIFGVFPEMVTSDMRRVAKAVNFGIIYGISPFGLSRELGIPQKESREYIDGYFARYPKVKEYMENTKKKAYEKGYTTTILNRRRYIPELEAKNKNVREFGERTAINTPVQGSAADLIKVAMINIHNKIKEKNLKTKMILQVHDELVFEVKESEMEQVRNFVKKEMEGVMELKVPVVVDINTGKNWNEAH
jgi:DNA polymerase I